MKHLELSLILPAYNERENIAVFIPQIAEAFRDVAHEIIVVDDSSPDGTGEKVKKLARTFPQVLLFTRTEKKGIGSALRFGYHQAIGDVILSSDTDLSFRPEDLVRLYQKIVEGYDLVVGSRHSESSQYETPNFKIWLKYAASRWGNAVLTAIFRIPVKDFSVNCRAIRRDLWLKLNTKEDTNFFLFEVIFRAKEHGAKIAEIPVAFLDRRFGRSKINHIIEVPKAFYKMIVFLLFR